MSEVIGSEFFAANRERLRQLFTGTAPIVLTANGLLQRTSDETHPFKQDSSFWYLTGVEDADVILVMDKGREYLIVPDRNSVVEVFDGAIDKAELARRSGIKDVIGPKEGWKLLNARIKKVRHVATLAPAPAYIDFLGMYTNPARRSLVRKLKDISPDLELLDLRQHLSRMRMIKQPVEIEAIQQSIDITIDTLKDVTRPSRLSKYAHEYEIEADISHGFRKRGAQGHAFPPIVAGGVNACTMHPFGNKSRLASDELIVIDIGVDNNNYMSDLARTITLNGKLSRRQQQVYDAVCAAQDYAFSLLKPGTLMRDFEKDVENFIGEKLRELGLIKTISRESVREAFFPHATSHFLGIDTHDAGDYDEPLKPGVVLAVEPGIYVRNEGIGVRIEDDVLITEDGCKILSSRLPRLAA